jgi:IS605 OrfB family transposase
MGNINIGGEKMKEFRTVKKLKLTIVADTKEEREEKYKFIRDSQYAQYQGLNLAMGILVSGFLKGNRKLDSEAFKQAQKEMMAIREQTFEDINFGKGITSSSLITQKVKADFKTALKNGLAKGERNVTNYKRTFPLMIKGNADSCYDQGKRKPLDFYYDNDDIYIRWCNGIIFKVVLGTRINENTTELKHTLHKIIKGEYRVSQSSLQFDKNNNLIMNVNIRFKKELNTDFIEGRTLGVDLGLKYPAYVCLSDNTYIRKGLGSAEEFLKTRQQMKKRRTTLQHQLKLVKGGKGRNKKLKALEQFQNKERNFAKTYNHQLSCNIVKFAKENKCEFINLEKLTKEGFDNNILSSWSYYELQNMIEYKAERENIKVRYINPAYTSQKCSKCGYIDKENRKTQSEFNCLECGLKLNADHNAAINIANSTEYIK